MNNKSKKAEKRPAPKTIADFFNKRPKTVESERESSVSEKNSECQQIADSSSVENGEVQQNLSETANTNDQETVESQNSNNILNDIIDSSEDEVNTQVKKKYNYLPEWFVQFGVFEVASESNKLKELQCVVCKIKFTSCRKHVFSRHYEKIHQSKLEIDCDQSDRLPAYDSKDRKTCDIRLKKFQLMKDKIMKQSNGQVNAMSEYVSVEKMMLKASYNVALSCARNKWTFCDADRVKECLLSTMEIVLSSKQYSPDIKTSILKSIDKITSSRHTATRRVKILGAYLLEELKKIIVEDCVDLSLGIDESTDVNDIAQITLFIKIFHKNFTVSEHYLDLQSLFGRTTASDIFDKVQTMELFSVIAEKLGSIASDAAPAMTGKHNGFTARVKKHLKSDERIPVMSLPCIIHQVSLCCKVDKSKINEATFNTVWQITKLIRNRSSHMHRDFRNFVKSLDELATIFDLLNHNDVRWLSRGKILRNIV